jgi:hypothetical protein
MKLHITAHALVAFSHIPLLFSIITALIIGHPLRGGNLEIWLSALCALPFSAWIFLFYLCFASPDYAHKWDC